MGASIPGARRTHGSWCMLRGRLPGCDAAALTPREQRYIGSHVLKQIPHSTEPDAEQATRSPQGPQADTTVRSTILLVCDVETIPSVASC
ncbi:hypothetical protein E2C01_058597 [Portunus trituberculatus]|uniref:Uncharacterized protein n=1 Tax=Portunus trituberculatus TaxID=210409 RepID=A0A5B7GWX5_PORTR|nr:hypothetical protein [Portunus trituberculatus]